MKVCFAVPLGVVLLFAAACGGATQRPLQTPFADSTGRTPTTTETAAALSADACSGEPETINGYRDEDGCPDSSPALTSQPIVFTGWLIQGPDKPGGMGEAE